MTSRKTVQYTHFKILDKIIENAEAFRVLTVLDIDERSNFSSLCINPMSWWAWDEFLSENNYLERDMVIPNPNFELLLPNDVLFRPIRIVFPEKKSWVSGPSFVVTGLLRDLTSFYNTFEFFYNKRTNPHCREMRTKVIINDVSKRGEKRWLTLFTDQTVVPVVGIIRVTKTTMGELEFEELVAMLAWVSSAARNSCK